MSQNNANQRIAIGTSIVYQCPTCGEVVDEKDNFCRNCGIHLPHLLQTRGSILCNRSSYCSDCGSPLNHVPLRKRPKVRDNQPNREITKFLRIRRKRLRPHLTQEYVAEQAGISITWYQKIEQGRAENPSLDVLVRITKALNLSDEETRHLVRLARPDLVATK